MANSLGTTSNGKVVAQRALELLVEQYGFVSQIVGDYSDATARKGDSITTHIISVQSAADYSTTQGYLASDVTQTDVAITLNKFKHVSYSINDDERTSSSVNLIERFAEQAAHAIGKAMVDDVLALVTTHFTSTLSISAGAVTFGSIVDCAATLNTNKVPMGGRFAVLSPGNYGNLSKDAVVVANGQRNTDLVGSADLGVIHGVSINAYPSLPAAVSKGFVGQREALLVATRLPEVPAGVSIPGEITNVSEPKTGISLQLREFYDIGLGSHQRTLSLIYGCSRGSTSSLVRIV